MHWQCARIHHIESESVVDSFEFCTAYFFKTPNLVCHLSWFSWHEPKELTKGIVISTIPAQRFICCQYQLNALSYLSQVLVGNFGYSRVSDLGMQRVGVLFQGKDKL